MDRYQIKQPLFALVSIILSIVILLTGMCLAHSKSIAIMLYVILFVLIILGYGKPIYKTFYGYAITCAIILIISYFSKLHLGKEVAYEWVIGSLNRYTTLYVVSIFGLALEPQILVASFNKMRCPRALTLSMLIVTSFMPLFIIESRKIRKAMKTRGVAGKWYKMKNVYRAFIFPFMVRLINISDILAVSIETRGFSLENKNYTQYRDVSFKVKDLIGIFLICAALAGGITVCQLQLI